MQGLKRCICYWTWIGRYYILSGTVAAAIFGILGNQKSGMAGVLDNFSVQLFIMGFAISVLAQIMNGIYIKQSLGMGAGRKNCFWGLQYHNLLLFGGFYLINLLFQKIVEMIFGFSGWMIDVGTLGFAYLIFSVIAAGISNFMGIFILYHNRIGMVLMTILCGLAGGVLGINFVMVKDGKTMLSFLFPQSQHAFFWILIALVVYVFGSLGQYMLLRKYEVRI